MPVASYPSTLPCPAALTSTSAERRLLSAQPAQQARAISKERLAVVSLSWTLTDVQAALFADWFDADLEMGGSWFTASWPTPEGLLLTSKYRFMGQPRWDYIPGGFWAVSAVCEVQGYVVVDILLAVEFGEELTGVVLPPIDPNFADVSLLLHANNIGTPGTFLDSSSVGHTVTAHGNATQVATPAKWGVGAGSLFQDASPGAWLTIPSHSSLIFGMDDFTMEGFIRLPGPYGGGEASAYALTGRHLVFVADSMGSGNDWSMYLSVEPAAVSYPPQFGMLNVQIYYADGTTNSANGTIQNFLVDTWYYWALKRSGSTFTLWKGTTGATVQQATFTNSKSIRARGGEFIVGATHNGRQAMHGHFDDFRVTNGVARDVSSVPTTPFEDE